jgi:hypothetical protein
MEPARTVPLGLALAGASLAALSACTEHSRRPDEHSPPPACPEDGWIDDRVPLFPGTEIQTRRRSTRGSMDSRSYVGAVAAPFRRVRAFYVQCLGSEAEGDEGKASFSRPVNGSRWQPGSGPLVEETPGDMVDGLTLWDRGDGTTEVAIRIAIPGGR